TKGDTTFAGATDATGAYLINNLPAGSYTVTATEDSHQTFTGDTTISAASTTQLSFTLAALGTVTGTVTKSGGGALANVVVYAADSTGLVESTVTDVNGAYQLPGLDAGTYRIIVGDTSGPGIAQSQAIINSNNPTRTVNFALVLGGTVSGTVR